MHCNVQIEKSYEVPEVAGTFRFLFGLTALFLGLFIALFTDFYGHGLGFLLVFGSPFMLLKDNN